MLQKKGRNRVIPGHIGIYDNKAFENALFYLNSLQTKVQKAPNAADGENPIFTISIEDCLARTLTASEFEREFHEINLRLIIERKLFMPDAEIGLN